MIIALIILGILYAFPALVVILWSIKDRLHGYDTPPFSDKLRPIFTPGLNIYVAYLIVAISFLELFSNGDKK